MERPLAFIAGALFGAALSEGIRWLARSGSDGRTVSAERPARPSPPHHDTANLLARMHGLMTEIRNLVRHPPSAASGGNRPARHGP